VSEVDPTNPDKPPTTTEISLGDVKEAPRVLSRGLGYSNGEEVVVWPGDAAAADVLAVDVIGRAVEADKVARPSKCQVGGEGDDALCVGVDRGPSTYR
jgi:hypothetical protein